jgi:hypothetical protein
LENIMMETFAMFIRDSSHVIPSRNAENEVSVVSYTRQPCVM